MPSTVKSLRCRTYFLGAKTRDGRWDDGEITVSQSAQGPATSRAAPEPNQIRAVAILVVLCWTRRLRSAKHACWGA